MNTWQLTVPKHPMAWIDASPPPPGPREVSVKLDACGLGRFDLDVWSLDAPPLLPTVLGAEGVGRVTAVGSEVTIFRVGDRVGLTPLRGTCLECSLCARGLERYCADARLRGLHGGGGLRREGNFEEAELFALPPHADPKLMAPLLGSGWTAIGAVHLAGIGAGSRVVLFGCGGVGHLVLQIARHRGAEVAVIEIEDGARSLAEQLGAVFTATPQTAAKEIHARWKGGADVAILCTASTQAIQEAIKCIRREGQVVLGASAPSTRFDLPLHPIVTGGVTVRGSFLGTQTDLRELLVLFSEGKVTPVVETAELGSASDQLWRVRDGGIRGRLVLV